MKQHFTDERTGSATPCREIIICPTLLTKCELNRHFADVNRQAEDMFFRLVKQMAECEGVTEKLKADNQMEWVAQMNNICSRATEIVNHDIIYN